MHCQQNNLKVYKNQSWSAIMALSNICYWVIKSHCPSYIIANTVRFYDGAWLTSLPLPSVRGHFNHKHKSYIRELCPRCWPIIIMDITTWSEQKCSAKCLLSTVTVICNRVWIADFSTLHWKVRYESILTVSWTNQANHSFTTSVLLFIIRSFNHVLFSSSVKDQFFF